MGRTLNFDRDTAIRAARTLFWRLGYEGAAIPDLEKATGLRRSSLYNAFGSKRGLYDAAVQSYLDEVIRPLLQPLQSEDLHRDAILLYLTHLRDVFSSAESLPAINGCLLINSAGAPIARDPRAAQIIADYRSELQEALGRGIRVFLPSLPPSEHVRLTDTITGLVISAFATTRIAPNAAQRSIEVAIETLGQPDR